jgi:ATP-dependent Clp protease ATP-binding subunit ClpA
MGREMSIKTAINCFNTACFASGWLSARSFDDGARRIVLDAKGRTHARGIRGMIPNTIVLWSMLRWERKLAVAAMEALADVGSIEREVELLLKAVPSTPRFSAMDFIQVQELCEQAVLQAAATGRDYVGSEHLLLALLVDDRAEVAQLLTRHSVTAEKVTQWLFSNFYNRAP